MKKFFTVFFILVMSFSLCSCINQGHKVNLTVYYSDDNAQRFLTRVVEIKALNEDVIVKELINAGVLKDPAKANSMSQITHEGKSAILLDMNADFQKQVSAMGTSGEYMMVGSVVNTFLSAYQAEEILITVDGKTMETGHEIYDRYLTQYPDNIGDTSAEPAQE